MKTIFLVALALASSCVSFANTIPPTKASIEKLLILTDVKKMVTLMHSEVAGVATGLMKSSLKGKPLGAAEEAALQKIITEAQESVSWRAMCDAYAPLYQENFTQAEIDGMIAFYESPAGHALMTKMPSVAKEAQMIMRNRLVPVFDKIKASIQVAQPAVK